MTTYRKVSVKERLPKIKGITFCFEKINSVYDAPTAYYFSPDIGGFMNESSDKEITHWLEEVDLGEVLQGVKNEEIVDIAERCTIENKYSISDMGKGIDYIKAFVWSASYPQIRINYNGKDIYSPIKITGRNLYMFSCPKEENPVSLDVYTNEKTHDLFIEKNGDDELVECSDKEYELSNGDYLYSALRQINSN